MPHDCINFSCVCVGGGGGVYYFPTECERHFILFIMIKEVFIEEKMPCLSWEKMCESSEKLDTIASSPLMLKFEQAI